MTIIGAITGEGSFYYQAAASTNTESALAFLEHLNGLMCLKGHVMIMDNHRAHYSNLFKDRVHELGLHVLFLPPTTSMFNPIETVWALVK